MTMSRRSQETGDRIQVSGVREEKEKLKPETSTKARNLYWQSYATLTPAMGDLGLVQGTRFPRL
jgi:hypothetical protein